MGATSTFDHLSGTDPEFVHSRSVEVSGTLGKASLSVVIQQGLPVAPDEPYVLALRSAGMAAFEAGEDGCAFECTREQLELLAAAVGRALDQARLGGLLTAQRAQQQQSSAPSSAGNNAPAAMAASAQVPAGR